jgi:hypothetical protein
MEIKEIKYSKDLLILYTRAIAYGEATPNLIGYQFKRLSGGRELLKGDINSIRKLKEGLSLNPRAEELKIRTRLEKALDNLREALSGFNQIKV